MVRCGAVRCGAVHTCSHICFINRFMMSEGDDPLSLPLTSKTGQSHSVAQNREASFFFFFFFFLFFFIIIIILLASKKRTYLDIL